MGSGSTTRNTHLAAQEKRKRPPKRGRLGGDGGNRTRVRRFHPATVYKLSLAIHLACGLPPDREVPASQPHDLSVSFAHPVAECAAPHLFVAGPNPNEGESGGVPSCARRLGLPLAAARPLEEEPQSQCDWHLWFCADLSRSAPLGLRVVVIHLRRNRSSPRPYYNIIA